MNLRVDESEDQDQNFLLLGQQLHTERHAGTEVTSKKNDKSTHVVVSSPSVIVHVHCPVAKVPKCHESILALFFYALFLFLKKKLE